MSETVSTSSGSTLIADIENNLSALACHAAIELDSLVRQQPIGVSAIQKLRARISDSVLPQSSTSNSPLLLDTTTGVAVNHALKGANLMQCLTVADLAKETEKIAKVLELIVDKSQSCKSEDLKRMRAFCLSLSRAASSFARPIESSRSTPDISV